jgi:hypothetical protein
VLLKTRKLANVSPFSVLRVTNARYLDGVLALDSSRRPDSALCCGSTASQYMAHQQNEDTFCCESGADSSVNSLPRRWITLHGPRDCCSGIYNWYVQERSLSEISYVLTYQLTNQ